MKDHSRDDVAFARRLAMGAWLMSRGDDDDEEAAAEKLVLLLDREPENPIDEPLYLLDDKKSAIMVQN